MALKGSYTTKDGITHSEAYARVIEVNQNKGRSGAHITVEIYHDEASKEGGFTPIDQKSYDLPHTISEADGDTPAVVIAFADVLGLPVIEPEGENDYKSVYENLLKELSEWSDWTNA